MPKPKRQELGRRRDYSLRVGINVPEWLGINQQMDPGAIADSQFQQGINVRISGSYVRERGGQQKILTNPLTGSIWGMEDVSTEAPSAGGPGGGQAFGLIGIAGTQVVIISPVIADGTARTPATPSAAAPQLSQTVSAANGRMFATVTASGGAFVIGDIVSLIHNPTNPTGFPIVKLVDRPSVALQGAFDGWQPVFLNGTFYEVLNAGGSLGVVLSTYALDQGLFTTETVPAIGTNGLTFVFNGSVYMIDSGAKIQKRTAISTFTPIATFPQVGGATPTIFQWAPYKGGIVFLANGGGLGQLFFFDGTNITLIGTTWSGSGRSGIFPCVIGGILYGQLNIGANEYIWKYDGTTFTNNWAFIGGPTNNGNISWVLNYADMLVISYSNAAAGIPQYGVGILSNPGGSAGGNINASITTWGVGVSLSALFYYPFQ